MRIIQQTISHFRASENYGIKRKLFKLVTLKCRAPKKAFESAKQKETAGNASASWQYPFSFKWKLWHNKGILQACDTEMQRQKARLRCGPLQIEMKKIRDVARLSKKVNQVLLVTLDATKPTCRSSWKCDLQAKVLDSRKSESNIRASFWLHTAATDSLQVVRWALQQTTKQKRFDHATERLRAFMDVDGGDWFISTKE